MDTDLTKVAQDSARGGFFLVSGFAFSTIILAIAAILIARFLGPELYGQYSLALVAPQILFFFTDLGISLGITKFSAELRSKGEISRISSIIKHGLIIRIIIGLVLFSVNFVFADVIAGVLFQRPEIAVYIQLASISIPFQVIFTTTISSFVGLDKTEYQAISMNVESLTKMIGSVSLIFFGFGVVGAIIGHVMGFLVAALSALLLLYLVLRKMRISKEIGDFVGNLKVLFQYGIPIYISVLLFGFLPLMMNLILAFFTADADIGNYKAAVNFAQMIIVIAGPIATILLPAFSKLNVKNTQKIREFFQITVKYTTLLIIPVVFLILLFSEEVIYIIYGGTYNSASIYLSSYCLVYLFIGMGYFTLPSIFNGLGETKTAMKMRLITFILLIFFAIPLTQIFGVLGLILSFLIANCVSTFYGAVKAKRMLQVKYDIKKTIRIYLIAIVSSIIPFLISNFLNLSDLLNLVLGGIIFLFSYITLMPLSNIMDRLEIEKVSLATQNTPFLKQIAGLILKYQLKILQFKLNFAS